MKTVKPKNIGFDQIIQEIITKKITFDSTRFQDILLSQQSLGSPPNKLATGTLAHGIYYD